MEPIFLARLDALGAAISQANAAWWGVLVNLLAAAATLSAVLFALRSEGHRLALEAQEKRSVNNAAKDAIFNAYSHCKAVTELFEADRINHEVANDQIAVGASHRRTLEHYLQSRVSSAILVFHANAAIERLIEVEGALEPLTLTYPASRLHIDEWRNRRDHALSEARSRLKRVMRRIADDMPLVEAAVL